MLICGFLAWREEHYFVPGKHSAFRGRGGGFYLLIMGFMLSVFCVFGLGDLAFYSRKTIKNNSTPAI